MIPEGNPNSRIAIKSDPFAIQYKRKEVALAHYTEVIASCSELLSLHCPRHPHLLWRLGYLVSRLYVVFTINFITFPHVLFTFLHVLPMNLAKENYCFSYVPTRSVQQYRDNDAVKI